MVKSVYPRLLGQSRVVKLAYPRLLGVLKSSQVYQLALLVVVKPVYTRLLGRFKSSQVYQLAMFWGSQLRLD